MQTKVTRVIRNVLAAAAVSGITFATQAADGKINFTGTILDSACTIDTSTANQTVNLGKIPKSSFSAAGSVAAATRFSIMLNNCPAAVTSASIKFDGTADSSDTSILALNSDQTAKGVGVAFYEEDGITAIPLATQSKSITLDTSAGEDAANSNKMTFVAKYKATQAAVVAGTANATSDFTITYQ
ncbi:MULTISPECIES: fimbrial protein [Enterobacter]|uniref:fimbrial protein n=1 Tax=Enterobacter TaxID=547 RepID=UPI0021D359D0|nr:fimbrial protein [Enterobacter quasiroggenkampii]MCU6398712.1 fimbrial protein [Enterobacter quasiroggenkampii]